MSTTTDRVLALIVAHVDRPADPETPIADLDLDSLEFLNLLQAIENECGVRIDDSALPDEATVGDILAAVLG